jgi:hypothetical protein
VARAPSLLCGNVCDPPDATDVSFMSHCSELKSTRCPLTYARERSYTCAGEQPTASISQLTLELINPDRKYITEIKLNFVKNTWVFAFYDNLQFIAFY